MERRIVCAAIKNSAGDIAAGARHYDGIMQHYIQRLHEARGYDAWAGSDIEQGFIDQRGIFLTREEAYIVAIAAGQIIRRCGGDDGKLYSENLY